MASKARTATTRKPGSERGSQETAAPAIEIRNLSKTFGKTRALRGVSITVQPGERVALIGASGSGKSTLIRHIACLVEGDKGNGAGVVRVHGQNVQSGGKILSSARAVRRQIGMIFQQFNLVARMSVINNVLVGLLGHIPDWRGNLGIYTKAEKLKAMRALDKVGIAGFAANRAQRLSGGQQQRVAIARSLVQDARVILADEPIASLDPKSAKRVMEILVDLNRELGITLITSLHQVDYAGAYFDRVVAMRDGEIAYDGPASKLTTSFLTEIYGAAADELILPGQIGPEKAAARGAKSRSGTSASRGRRAAQPQTSEAAVQVA